MIQGSKRHPGTAHRLLVLLILLLAAYQRFNEIGTSALWADEQFAADSTAGGTLASAYQNLPLNWSLLYPVTMTYARRLAGDSPLALRWPSALFGVLGVAGIYALGRRLFSARAGIAAAALMAIADGAILPAQEARSYAALMTLVTLSAIPWWKLVTCIREGRLLARRAVVSYVVLALLAMYSHYFGVLMVGIEALWLLIVAATRGRGQRLLGIAGLYVLLAVLYTPGVVKFVMTWLANRGSDFSTLTWVEPPGPFFRALLDILFAAINKSARVFSLMGLLWAAAWGLLLARQRLSRGDVMLVLWVGVPFVLSYLVSVTFQPLLLSRYLVVTFPAIYLITGRAVDVLTTVEVG